MCAENEYARIVTKMASGIPTIPLSASHNNGDWLETDIYEGELYIDSDTGKIYTRTTSGIIDTGLVGSFNIYNTDDVFTDNRIADLDGNTLLLKDGQLTVGDVGAGTQAGFNYINTAAGNGFLYNSPSGDGNAFTAIMDDANTFGLNLKASHNKVFDSDITPDPTNENSSLFTVWSTRKGTLTVPRMTEAERDAIASPADYLEIVNTTRERKEIYKPFWGWHPVGIITPDWGYWWIDEATGASGEFVFSATNGGLLTTLIDSTLSPTRLAGLSTGVNTNGEYRQITNPYLLGSTGLKSWSTKVAFDTLSNITNRYVARSGYVNNSAGLSTSIGMYFLYDEGGIYGTATASDNWLCVCFTSGSPTIVDSGIPVTASPANPLQRLQILDSGTGNNVEFYIDNALVATITTQIPTSSQTLSAGNIITKQAGTTARIMYDDYVEAKEKFNTPR